MRELIKNANHRERIEDVMLFIGLIGPFAAMPQLYKIFISHDGYAHGVSFVTWLIYAFLAAFWSIYGLVFGKRALFLSNMLTSIIDFIIVGRLFWIGCFL
ncbi:hypothetical protein [Aureibacter tunicatorum]|uniref:Uncharacterized protein with PQ loop repeat n=1 Tax=Aureibacter tunicatorum TaxID=866807 RepID=A0AAE3XNL4_9BACT|nr:hypothetical protein [Aureibacter tunicatorum]MDR6240257.1 uncharacterized protein with PQ loop repeat [Aureibacter tunicatorum]BDD05862.1 hypothetical protein AUTU_33450 [Aureibacter tunicatorum]